MSPNANRHLEEALWFHLYPSNLKIMDLRGPKAKEHTFKFLVVSLEITPQCAGCHYCLGCLQHRRCWALHTDMLIIWEMFGPRLQSRANLAYCPLKLIPGLAFFPCPCTHLAEHLQSLSLIQRQTKPWGQDTTWAVGETSIDCDYH